MTNQPRDLAAEVERIRLEVAKQFDHVANRENCNTLLLHIAALSRELDAIKRTREQEEQYDGMCHELQKAREELNALRRPVEQSYAQDVRQYVSTKTLHEPCHSHFDVLLSVLDTTARQLRERVEMLEAAQGEIRAVGQANQNLTNRCATLKEEINCAGITTDRLQAEIARLSSPPEPLAPIATQIMRWMSANDAWRVHPELCENITKLIDGCANLRNAHQDRGAMLSVVQDSLSERNRECVELRERVKRLEGALRVAKVYCIHGICPECEHPLQHAPVKALLDDINAALAASQQPE